MPDLEREISRLLEKYPDPRKGEEWRIEFRHRKETEAGLPRFGTVADNKDPLCLGRVRVACDTIAPGAVTPWIQMIALGATKGTGWWQLPDIGTQVLMAFVGKGHSNPVVLGCIYDLKHRPPKHSTEKASDSKVYQTKKHRLEFIDEEGKETLIISSAKGQMRCVLGKEKGIELVNELGDMKIKCRKLKIEGGKGISIEGKKKVSMNSEDKTSIKASKGITAEGKQIAAEGDKVMGFDVHQMVVPSGPGTAVVPLPHPFIGKLADKLSKDVKIKGHNAAVKGSVAKHDDPVHNQLPGTIQFQQAPKKEGEVTGGTSGKVKINGKEAAVVGSTVTTCNDVGARDNSTVLAIGASIPMPVIINPKNTKEYLLEREKEKKINPEITNARWNKTSVKEGEKAELTAQVKDIADGNMLTFQVWKERQDPAVNIPYARITKEIQGGQAKAEMEYNHPADKEIPDKDMKFFMTVHSAWCPPKKSECVEIKLRRPEIKEKNWKDKEDKQTEKGNEGEELVMEAVFNEDMEEGAGLMFRVYKEGADPKRDKPVHEAGSRNEGGKARAGWTYRYEHDPDNPLTEKPKFFFAVNAQRCKEAKSASVEMGMDYRITVKENDESIENTLCAVMLSDGSREEAKTDENGLIELKDRVPGIVMQIEYEDEEGNAIQQEATREEAGGNNVR